MRCVRVVAIAATVLFAGAASAQEPEPQLPETPNTQLYARLEQAVIKIHRIFGGPVHPVIATVAPGGGWGAGVGYDAPGRGPFDLKAKALWTLHNYWLAEGVASYEVRRAKFEAFGRAREMSRLDYYGSGNSSNLFNRTTFAYRDPVVGALGTFRVTPWATLGGRVEEIWPYARAGKRLPSIESRFYPNDAPGLFEQPRYGRYQGSVELELPAAPGNAFFQGTKSRFTYAIYDQQTEGEAFNFRRFDAEAKQVFAGFAPHHRLTLSGWVATTMTDAGQDVPFFLQPTLGGKSEIVSVHDDRLGGDGTDATLRGYRDLRFRDRNLLLLQAEYRVPIWGPIDATAFADAGKVAPTRSDLDFNDLRRDVGFSLSIMKGWETWARMDVAFGSGEGVRVFFSLGDLTP
ncbi:MAG TPA: hypothetical protein VJ825_11675 [Gemmatimonadaceae bacterium]|nr:hypothetical protein [Gemmatimonadaceae bacterium]